MRQWMCHPKILCRKHLLGEHVEMHMFAGHIKRKRAVKNYVKNNLVEIKKIKQRHDHLAREMKSRGYKHKSPIQRNPDVSYLPENEQNYIVNAESALKDLTRRCSECKYLYEKYKKSVGRK